MTGQQAIEFYQLGFSSMLACVGGPIIVILAVRWLRNLLS